MHSLPTRRQVVSTLVGAISASAAASSAPVIESHIHLFSADVQRFPFSSQAPYRPAAHPVEAYVPFATAAGIQHVVIVHPEPYQDDHRYLEYCFAHAPRPDFFKGTCLFDPIAPDTPDRLEALVKRYPDRIVALRIHEMSQPGAPPLTSGPIKDRDLRSPAMRATWGKVQDLGLMIQMHFLPHFAPAIGELAVQFPRVPVILDHLGRGGQETPDDFAAVLQLARLPQTYLKFSGVGYSSKQPFPYADAKPLVRRAFDAFGPDRMMWGGLGYTLQEFAKQKELFDFQLDFAKPVDRDKIRGLTALKLFRW